MSEVELTNPEELEKDAGKRFSKRVALTTAIYAVLLAITSLGAALSLNGFLLLFTFPFLGP